MPRSSELQKLVTNALKLRIDKAETDIQDLVDNGSQGGLSAGDNISELINDSNYQTAAEVQALIDGLIGGAPGTLDTLGEISALLEDDTEGLGALVAANAALQTEIDDLKIQVDDSSALAEVNSRTNRIATRTLSSNTSLLATDLRYQNLIVTQPIDVTLPAGDIDLSFAIKNSKDSTDDIRLFTNQTDFVTISPRETHEVIFDGTEWVVY